MKGIDLPAEKDKVVFDDDSSIAGYAKDWVYKMQVAGIIYGEDNNMFDPLGLATRAEAAALFVRIDEKLI